MITFWIVGWLFTMGVLADRDDGKDSTWDFWVFLALIMVPLWPVLLGNFVSEISKKP